MNKKTAFICQMTALIVLVWSFIAAIVFAFREGEFRLFIYIFAGGFILSLILFSLGIIIEQNENYTSLILEKFKEQKKNSTTEDEN